MMIIIQKKEDLLLYTLHTILKLKRSFIHNHDPQIHFHKSNFNYTQPIMPFDISAHSIDFFVMERKI